MALDAPGSAPDTDTQSQDTPETGKREPRHKRVERQRDRLYDALDMQSRKIDSLVNAVESLVTKNDTSNGQTTNGNSLDAWDQLSDADLRQLISNDETEKGIRDTAMLKLVDRDVKRQVGQVRDEVRKEFRTNLDAQKRGESVANVIVSKFGEDALDTDTEQGALTERFYRGFQEKYPDDDLSLRPEYRFIAAELAAEQLGLKGSSGSGEDTDADTETTTDSVPSKSGPPPGASPVGSGGSMAERLSRAQESLKKGTPEGNKEYLREVMQRMGFPGRG